MLPNIRLYAALALAAGVLFGDVWIATHFYNKGVQHEKDKITREINNAVREGNSAKEEALRRFDALPDGDGASSVPDDGFRRP